MAQSTVNVSGIEVANDKPFVLPRKWPRPTLR